MPKYPPPTLSFLNQHYEALLTYNHKAEILLDRLQSHQFSSRYRQSLQKLQDAKSQHDKEEQKKQQEEQREQTQHFIELHQAILEHHQNINEELEQNEEYRELIQMREDYYADNREHGNIIDDENIEHVNSLLEAREHFEKLEPKN